MTGLQMAAAYSMRPNELGRCGPKDVHARLYDFAQNPAPKKEAKIREILAKFEVATPYYQLIARANGIDDIFDKRVVEAYWLGNKLLDQVGEAAVRAVIREDVERCGWDKRQIALLFSGVILNHAKPHHSLSVLYFFVRPGSSLMLPTTIKERIDACRVSFGRVHGSSSLSNDRIMVSYCPITFSRAGKAIFCKRSKIHGIQKGFLGDVQPGDVISFHLDWGIQKLTATQAANLKKYTALSIAAVNG